MAQISKLIFRSGSRAEEDSLIYRLDKIHKKYIFMYFKNDDKKDNKYFNENK